MSYSAKTPLTPLNFDVAYCVPLLSHVRSTGVHNSQEYPLDVTPSPPGTLDQSPGSQIDDLRPGCLCPAGNRLILRRFPLCHAADINSRLNEPTTVPLRFTTRHCLGHYQLTKSGPGKSKVPPRLRGFIFSTPRKQRVEQPVTRLGGNLRSRNLCVVFTVPEWVLIQTGTFIRFTPPISYG